MTYHRREIVSLVLRGLDSLPVVVLTGLRQAGKTTLLLQDKALASRRFMTLDDYATLEAARREPEALLGNGEPVTIDEAQRCPELLIAVKRAVDRRRTPGRFLLSGSANFALLKGVSESLAGRALYLTLHPFTRREKQRSTAPPFLPAFFERPHLTHRREVEPLTDAEVLDGGLPPIVTGQANDRGLWFLGYEQTYLERDVRDLSQVADLVLFRNLMRLAAFRTARILNQSELARDARLPASTVSRYLGLLETSFVLARVPPYLRSRATRLIKSHRLFVTDSGLASHLTATRDLSHTNDQPLRGRLYETYVHQNLSALVAAHFPEADLCFWSVQGRHEVDFVISLGSRSLAIEVKAGTRFGKDDWRGLEAFLTSAKGATAGVLAYNGSEAVKVGERLYAVPLGLLLS